MCARGAPCLSRKCTSASRACAVLPCSTDPFEGGSQGVGCVQAISSQVSRGMLVKDICVEKEVGNFLGLSITKIGADHACLSVDGEGFPLTQVLQINIQKSLQKSLQQCLSN